MKCFAKENLNYYTQVIQNPLIIIVNLIFKSTYSLGFLLHYLQIFFFGFSGPHLWHIEVPRLGVRSELHLLAFAIATQDPSRVYNLLHSSWQCWIFNPLIEARDQTCNLMDPSWICFRCASTGTPARFS